MRRLLGLVCLILGAATVLAVGLRGSADGPAPARERPSASPTGTMPGR